MKRHFAQDIVHSLIDVNNATNRYASRERVWRTIMNVFQWRQAFYPHTMVLNSFQGYKKMAPSWNKKQDLSSEDL